MIEVIFHGRVSKPWSSGRVRLGAVSLLPALCCLTLGAASSPGQKLAVADLMAADLYYSPEKALLYASVQEDSPRHANSVAVIDPIDGDVVNSMPIGSRPGLMAPSVDGRYLYVAVDGEHAVRRIDLASGQVGAPFPVRIATAANETATAAMLPIAGKPDSVVVARRDSGSVAVYLDGQALPHRLPSTAKCGTLAYGKDPGTMWCYDTSSDGFVVSELLLSEAGVALGRQLGIWFLDCCFGGGLEYYDGLLYTKDGVVFDPETGLVKGSFSDRQIDFPTGDFHIDRESGRIYFGRREGFLTYIWEFDIPTFRPLSRFTSTFSVGTGLRGQPSALTRCGAGGLATIDSLSREVVIYPMSNLEPLPLVNAGPPELSPEGIPYFKLPNREIQYDFHSDQIFAATPSAPGIGNSLVRVDARTLAVRESIWIGSEPWHMALSSDGRYLYQSFISSNSIRRVDLATFRPDLSFQIYPSNLDPYPISVSSLLVLPDSSETLAVSLAFHPEYDPLHDSLAILDSGQPRPERVLPQFHSLNSVIQLDSTGSYLYGLNSGAPEFELSTNKITPEGVVREPGEVKQAGARGSDLKCERDICFTSNGHVIDAEQQKVLGKCPFRGAVSPDLERNRAYYLRPRPGGVEIFSCELTWFSVFETVEVTGVLENAVDLLDIGSDQLAFSTGAEIGVVSKSEFKLVQRLDAIVSSATYDRGPIAPGMLLSLFGSGIGEFEEAADGFPLPLRLGGSEVKLNGEPIPLLYASRSQINVLSPYSFGGGVAEFEVLVGDESIRATTEGAATAPSIFLREGYFALAHNEDLTINSPHNPARKLSRIIVYFTGQGAVTEPLPDRGPSPNGIVRTLAETTAVIGRKAAVVEFSGLVPGFAGLAQANLLIPEDVIGGHAGLVLTVGGVKSNAALIHVK